MWEEEQPFFFCINGALHKYAMVDFTNISWFTDSTFWNSLSLDADGMTAKNTSWTSTYVSRWKSVLNSLADQVSQVFSYFLSTRSLISVGFYKVGELRANMEVIVWFNLCYLDMKINICIMYSRRLYLVDSGLVLIPSFFIFGNISHLSINWIKGTRWTVLDTGTEC